MATIKHLTSKNSNYAAAESYLTFQHNEYTGLPILDEKGRPKLRDSYLLDTLECGESSFAMACLIANRKYGKNGGREDVKTHHYIVSFDPKDAVENGLTMERAQALGLQFCKDNFPGHPAIVCTHPDGHNSAGNIHVHIVIGSLRVRTVERQPFMDKPCDWEAGKKHRCTSAMLRHLRVSVMEMCEQADLNQINLLEAQGDHVSEREYRQYKPLAQKLQTVRNPAKFKEQHRAEFAVYEAACAYFKANGLRTLPDLKKLDAEYQTLSSEKNGFYTRYKKAQIELRELRTAQQNVEAFFRKEERSHAVPQQEVK